MLNLKTGKDFSPVATAPLRAVDAPSNPSRRSFLKGGLAAILASGLAPSVCGSITRGIGYRNLGGRLAAMGGGKKPYDREVDYLRGTGTQFIETEYLDTSYFNINAKVNFSTISYENDIAGNMDSDNQSSARFVLGVSVNYGLFLYSRYLGVNPGNISTPVSTNIDYTIKTTYTPNKKTLDVNGVYLEKNMDNIFAHNQLVKMKLFKAYKQNMYYLRGRIYYFEIIKNGTTWLNLIPVIATFNDIQEPCMFNRAYDGTTAHGQQFYRNSGSGRFYTNLDDE